VAAEVSFAGDEGRVGLAGERLRRVVHLNALSSGEPVDLQDQFPGVHGRSRPSFALHAVEQLTQRDRLDLVEVQLRERASQDAVVDRSTQRQRTVGQPLGAALGVGLELEVPRRPTPEAHGFGNFAALLDLGPRRRAPRTDIDARPCQQQPRFLQRHIHAVGQVGSLRVTCHRLVTADG
jgi:hypothetical protein